MSVPTAPPGHRLDASVRGRVAVVTFDHAARGNCFTTPALVDLVEALEAAAAAPDVAVVELVMAGRHFCAGWDTSTFAALADATVEEVAAALRANDVLLDRVRDLPVPLVAAVRGRVIGFGAGLLAAVHVPVAADDATLTLPEVGFGISPGGVLHALLGRLPETAVSHLALTGEPAVADDLLRWGLVARVVPAAEAEAAAAALAATIAAQPGDVVRTITAATRATLAAGSPEPAYAAAAASIVAPRRTS